MESLFMKVKQPHIGSLIMLLLLTACEDCAFVDSEYNLPFYNYSQDTVYTCITHCYPDTIPNTDYYRICCLPPGNDAKYVYTSTDQDPKKAAKNEVFCLFVIDKDTIKKYDFNTIKIGYKVLCRYDLRGKDFAKYKITYPPNEDMKQINMYPPYNQ